MGWSLGEDSNGRAIGYSVEAECDYPGCSAAIDRGLSYACGGTPGEIPSDEKGEGGSCEGFFCEGHKYEHSAYGTDGEPCPFVVEMSTPIAQDTTHSRC